MLGREEGEMAIIGVTTYLPLMRAGSLVGVQRSPDPPTRGLCGAFDRGRSLRHLAREHYNWGLTDLFSIGYRGSHADRPRRHMGGPTLRDSSPRRRRTATILAGFVLTLALPAVVLASSYWSTVAFSVAVNGAVRSYDNNDMNIELTSRAPVMQIKTYTIKLYRQSCVLFVCNDDFIGQVTVPRNGFGDGRWTNVGGGNYWFRFTKANDGATVRSDDVHMFSN